MAKYDHGGGCPCGLYAECEPNCEQHPANKMSSSRASVALMNMLRLSRSEKAEVVRRLETLLMKTETA